MCERSNEIQVIRSTNSSIFASNIRKEPYWNFRLLRDYQFPDSEPKHVIKILRTTGPISCCLVGLFRFILFIRQLSGLNVCPSNYPSIHPLSILLILDASQRWCLSSLGVHGQEVDYLLDVSPVYDRATQRQRQSTMHTLIPNGNLERPINLTVGGTRSTRRETTHA